MAVSNLLWDKIKFAPRKYFSPSLELCLCLLPAHPVVFQHPLSNVNTRTGHAIPVCRKRASIRWAVPDWELKSLQCLPACASKEWVCRSIISPLQSMLSCFFVMNYIYDSLVTRVWFLTSYLEISNIAFPLAKMHFFWMDQTFKAKSVSALIDRCSSCQPLWWGAILYLPPARLWDTP